MPEIKKSSKPEDNRFLMELSNQPSRLLLAEPQASLPQASLLGSELRADRNISQENNGRSIFNHEEESQQPRYSMFFSAPLPARPASAPPILSEENNELKPVVDAEPSQRIP